MLFLMHVLNIKAKYTQEKTYAYKQAFTVSLYTLIPRFFHPWSFHNLILSSKFFTFILLFTIHYFLFNLKIKLLFPEAVLAIKSRGAKI